MIRVLIVDDKPDNLYLLRALLQGHGYAVDEARNGAEAMTRARQEPPNVLISDLLMPVMDGYTLLRHWKADERLQTIPFVVYTATYTEPRDERLALDLGADAFIIKPVEPELFVACIEEVLEKKARGELLPTKATQGEETGLLKEYSEVLIHKLEKKVFQLEQANHALQEEIASREQAEAALLREKSFSDAIIEVLPGTFYLFDEQGKLLRWNKNLEQMAQDLGEEIFKMSPLDFFVGDARSRVEEAIQKGFSKGETFVEAEVLAKDGNETPYLFSAKRVSLYDQQCLMGVGIDISDRVRAEEELRKSQEMLDLALTGADLGWWDLNVRTGQAVVNQRTANMAGYSLDEIEPTLSFFLSLVHPDDRSRVTDALENHFSGRTNFYEVDYRILAKSGDWKWILSRGKVVEREENGSPLRMTGTFMDITERKRSEDALRENEEQFRSLFENSLDAILLTIPDGRVLRANPAACQMFGMTEGEILRIGREGVVDTTDPRLKLALEVRKRTGKFQGELNFKRKDGSVFPAELSSILFKDAEGQGKTTMIVRDVTGRRRSEEVQKRLATAVEQAAEGILITDNQGIIEYVNPAFENITGYSREEAIGQNPRLLKSGQHDTKFYNHLWDTITGGKVWSGRFTNRKKDGGLYQEETTISPVKDKSGQIVNFVALKRDITEQLELSKQLWQAQKMEAVGTLAGGVAHDFNNVLQVALGYSDLILADEDLPQRYRIDLQKIHESARRGADLVQRLLTFSRKTDIKAKPINLNYRVKDLRKMLERTIPKMIEIQLSLSENLATINADPTQIDQVLMNLAVNARDAMPDGGRLIIETANFLLDEEYAKTHLEAHPGPHVLLMVTDTGVGMGRDTLEHIFEPFYTTKGEGEGTGLGLAMVHGIVKQHGGHIMCYSEIGQGTTFTIYFPALVSEEELQETVTRTMPKGGSETILLVDDEEFIRDLGSRVLTKAGYDVILASNGKDALKVYQQRSDEISLVILDLIMPEMGGKQCLEGLLSLNPVVKVVIASGYSANGPTKEALAAGAKGFVNKPYDIRQMLEVVRAVLDEDQRETEVLD